MEDMRRVAYATVLRACGFGSLAIFCFMVGLSFEPRIAFQSGGVLTMIMTGILLLKAQEARTKPYRRTQGASSAGSFCAAADLRSAARDLHDLCAVDVAGRRGDVGDRSVLFLPGPVKVEHLARGRRLCPSSDLLGPGLLDVLQPAYQ